MHFVAVTGREHDTRWSLITQHRTCVCRHERTPVDESLSTRPGDMEMLNLIASFQHDSRHKNATLPDMSAEDDDATDEERTPQDVR